MNLIRKFLLDETAKTRKRELGILATTRTELKVLNSYSNKYGWTEQSLTDKSELQSKIFRLEHPEAPHLASAAAAKSMTDRSESCTKLFFQTYKAIGKQQWINAVHQAE